ncbi:MAG: DnaB-like helicase C-terminal domain-containing protein [Nanoarchaeota archaeon]
MEGTFSRAVGSKKLFHETIGEVEKALAYFERHREKFIDGVRTGFPDIDAMTLGLKPGVSVIGARPEDGLTDFALTVCDNLVTSKDYRVLYFTGNLRSRQVAKRLLSISSRVSLASLEGGVLVSERDFPKITGASGRYGISDDILNIVDGKIDEDIVCSETRRFVGQKNKRKPIVFLDRFQDILPMNDESLYRPSRNIARELTDLANDLDLTMIVLSEMKKVSKTKIPTCADLRDFGAFEYDKLGMLLRKGDVCEQEELGQEAFGMDCFFTNNPYDKSNEPVRLTYLLRCGRFESCAKID